MEAKKRTFDAFIEYIGRNPESIIVFLDGNFRVDKEKNKGESGSLIRILKSDNTSQSTFHLKELEW